LISKALDGNNRQPFLVLKTGAEVARGRVCRAGCRLPRSRVGL